MKFDKKLQMFQRKGSNWNCNNYEDTKFCEALMDRSWGAYANESMEGHDW